MRIFEQSRTPDKSIVELKVNKKGVEQRIKYINKKGTFKKREQCKTCKHLGKVQLGLGYGMDVSCDREEGCWKECCGRSDRSCKFYENK